MRSEHDRFVRAPSRAFVRQYMKRLFANSYFSKLVLNGGDFWKRRFVEL